MSLTRIRAVATASLAILIVGTVVHAPPASAGPAVTRPATATAEDLPKVQIPPLVTESWNGTTGVNTLAERWRKAVADVAALTPEPEVRDAALAALATGDPAIIQKFATVDKPALDAQVAARKKQVAGANLAKVKAMAGTGGAYFNAEVQRVLAGTDSDRAAFLAYGADITRDRDAKVAADAAERATALRERVRLVAAAAPAESHVKLAAEAALAGDDATINAFLTSGYLTAARADAAEREQYLKDLEARNNAAEKLTELAQKSARASEARKRLLAAHGQGVRALQRASNAMAAAANAARHATRVLGGPGTAATKATELAAADAESKRQLGYAQQAAQDAAIAAQIGSTAANDLIETGLDYGVEWSLISQGMSEAATAAVGATQTAQHAIGATVATNNAQGAQAQAEAHAQQAIKWRQHAQEHAKAAAKLAAAAAKQAAAAKTAAARTKKAREQAEAAEKEAWAAAERARRHRQTAEAEAAEAKRQRQIAEAERANAAAARQRAEAQAAIASNARANAEAQAATAAGARQRADAANGAANDAEVRAWGEEDKASRARDAALAAERAEQTAKAEAATKRAWAAQAAGSGDAAEAKRQADQADQAAGTAGSAARSARASANTATGAATNARAAATQADQAAARAWAAAERAQAAAARADAAADAAEAEAKAAHSARLKAEARAAEATRQEIKAADAARAAQQFASQAAEEAVRSLWAAERVRDEAQAAISEAVAAATQADIAVGAAVAARVSAAGIADPANTAIGLVSPFSGDDIDADFVKLVAEQAKLIGAEQAAAAEQRANEAVSAAGRAAEAARTANEQVRPAFEAAAAAAESAAAAAKSAAEAKKSAAQAAVDGAAARAAAASAVKADEQARADAAAARQAANEAASDAAIAGKAAAAAQAEADAANNAASRAEADAAAASGAADQAEADAAAAQKAAESAQKHADGASTAADQALQHAVEAQQAFERTEAAERERDRQARADAIAGGGKLTPEEERALLASLTPAEQDEYKQARTQADQGILDFIKANAGDLVMGLLGLDNLKGCFIDGNVSACLWALADAIPWGKAISLGVDLLKFLPKVARFVDTIKDARRKLDDLISRGRRGGCKSNSFVPGTRVLLDDGTAKAIDRLKTGDRVLATDPVTNQTAAKPVTATFASTGVKDLVDITIDTDGRRGDATGTVTATHNHPFWVPARSEWVDAAHVAPGQWLRTGAGTTVQVSAVRRHTAVTWVHNLTVADIHTYYVAVAGASVLVHNCPAYDELDEHGRATGITATLTKDTIGGRTNPRVDPAGWESGKGYNRAHLLGAQLGGSNTDPRNFVTMHQYANTPVMRGIENQVKKAVKSGQTVEYSVKPMYRGKDPLPLGVTITAKGSGGLDIELSILNRPKP